MRLPYWISLALRRTVAPSSTKGSEASILAMVAVIDWDSASFCFCWSMEASFANCSAACARIDDRVRSRSGSEAPAAGGGDVETSGESRSGRTNAVFWSQTADYAFGSHPPYHLRVLIAHGEPPLD